MPGILSRGAFGIEVGHGELRAASVVTKGGVSSVTALDSARLPAGTLIASFTEPNITDVNSFADAVRKLAGRMGRRGRRVNVALPDYVSRVVVLDFESLPVKAADADSMIRWKLKKLMPFNVEDASLRYQYLGVFREKDVERHKYIAAVIKSDILTQYEDAFAEAGLRPGRIDVASFAVWNMYREYMLKEASGRSFCLMSMCCGKMTLMVFEGGVVRFFRLKDLGLETQGPVSADSTEVMLRELRASLTYYKEHVSATPAGLVFVTGDMDNAPKTVSDIGADTGLNAGILSIDKVIVGPGVSYRSGDGVLYSAACGAAMER